MRESVNVRRIENKDSRLAARSSSQVAAAKPSGPAGDALPDMSEWTMTDICLCIHKKLRENAN